VAIVTEILPGLLVSLVFLVQAKVCEWRFSRAFSEIERLKADLREIKAQRAAVLKLEM